MSSSMKNLMKYLPCEVANIIWTKYYRTFVLPEMKADKKYKKRRNEISLQIEYEGILHEYVECVCKMYIENQEHFWICFDFVEDRILTDEWFVWDSMQYSLNVLIKTKESAHNADTLKRDIEIMYSGRNHLKSMISNLEMLKSLFEN